MPGEFTSAKQIQWFPGHMAKTRRKISEDLKLVDIVAEILDARIPESSKNPVLRDIVQSKPKVTLLNKSDLADPIATAEWVNSYRNIGETAIPIDSKNGKGIPDFYNAVRAALKERIAAWESKGMIGRPIRIMILGIPNVGKSSLINRLIMGSGAGKAVVQDRPGVTRQNKWFTAARGFELLDTPGVLWPKFDDPKVGRLLAYTGAIKDEILDIEDLACGLIELVMKLYPNAIKKRYGVEADGTMQGFEILEAVGKKRGMLVSGGEINTERAAIMLVDEFRAGKLGRINLEHANGI